MNDMWQKKIEWFRLKINKTSVFLIKNKNKDQTRASPLLLWYHSSSSSITLTAMPPSRRPRRPRCHASQSSPEQQSYFLINFQ